MNFVAPAKGQNKAVRVRDRFTGLWQHPDFLKLWIAQTISHFGTQISLLTIPLTAVLTLDATAFEMGVLTAMSQAPFLLVGLLAGVWVDRLRRRPVLIAADLGRFLLLLVIPLLAVLDVLRIEYLFAIVFLVGALTLFFDVADHSYLPALVGRGQLAEANGKLSMSRSVAQFSGPTVAGILVRLVTAPIAIVVDALTYLVSALFVALIRAPEPAPAPRDPGRSVWQEIREGVNAVLGNPILRPIAVGTATSNLFAGLVLAVFVLYATRTLETGAGVLGVIFAVGSIGALTGASAASAMTHRLGVGRSILAGMFIGSLGTLLVPLAQGPAIVTASLLGLARVLSGFGYTTFNINQVSLRQTITPDRLLGRMNASVRFIIWGTIPLGGLLGGVLGELIGLRPTLFVGAAGELLAVLLLGLSRVRTLREMPTADEVT